MPARPHSRAQAPVTTAALTGCLRSYGGGRAWATIATLLTTAKMNGVDPHAWLTQTLQRIAGGWPNSQIADLMPWNFKP